MNMPLVSSDRELLMERALDVKGRSLWVDARRRLLGNRAAVTGIGILSVVALLAIFGPFVSPYTYDHIDYSVVQCAPDWWPSTNVICNAGGAHWFGTDDLGRDLFVRVPVVGSTSHAPRLETTSACSILLVKSSVLTPGCFWTRKTTAGSPMYPASPCLTRGNLAPSSSESSSLPSW